MSRGPREQYRNTSSISQPGWINSSSQGTPEQGRVETGDESFAKEIFDAAVEDDSEIERDEQLV